MMTNRPTGFWHALEAVPGGAAVDAEWQTLFGTDYQAAKAFLRPNGKLASSYPCKITHGCGCEHEVVLHDSEDIVAVCRCERGCETFSLKRPDIVVYELDRQAFDAAIADAFILFKETDQKTDIQGTTCIGAYFPCAGFRFPVYLTIQIEPDELGAVVDGLLSRSDSAFILLAPSRDLCSSKVENRLKGKRSIFIALSETVAVGEKRQLRLLRPLDDILHQFRTINLPNPKDDTSMAFFPTPPDAAWGNVKIQFKDGHTLSVKVKSASCVFNYAQMGMANKKNSEPTKQWELLRTFADGHGTLDWTSSNADRRNQKRREILATNLRDFFRIDGDPFELTDDGQGWRAKFEIDPD